MERMNTKKGKTEMKKYERLDGKRPYATRQRDKEATGQQIPVRKLMLNKLSVANTKGVYRLNLPNKEARRRAMQYDYWQDAKHEWKVQ